MSAVVQWTTQLGGSCVNSLEILNLDSHHVARTIRELGTNAMKACQRGLVRRENERDDE